MRRYIGEMLVVVGALHTLTGLLAFGTTFGAMARDGLYDTLAADFERQLALWFTLAGPMLVMLGLFARWSLRRSGELPGWFGVAITLISLLGLLFLPRSGFWALLAVGLLTLWTDRAARESERRGATLGR